MNPARRAFGLAALATLLGGRLAQSAEKPDPIVIGQTMIATGPLAPLSHQPLLGIRAAIDAVNAKGGIFERKLELRQADDGYDAERAAANVRRFAEQGAVAILMPIGTVSSIGALKAANELKIPLLAPYSGARPVARHSPFGFLLRSSFEDEYRRLLDHMLPLGINRIAFVHNDNPGARGAMESTRDLLAQRGIQMLGSAAVRQDAADAEIRAAEIARLQPAAVIFSCTTEVVGRFIAGYRAAGAYASFYSFSFLNGSVSLKDIGESANGIVISQVVPFPWNSGLPLVREYQRAMREAGNMELSYASLEGYIAARVLIEAMRRAEARQVQPGSIKSALEAMSRLDLGGFTVHFSKNLHAGSEFSEISLLRKDGRYLV